MECFMRDVLIPLAAETNALIVGSAFRDASLMMMFSRVLESRKDHVVEVRRHGGVPVDNAGICRCT